MVVIALFGTLHLLSESSPPCLILYLMRRRGFGFGTYQHIYIYTSIYKVWLVSFSISLVWYKDHGYGSIDRQSSGLLGDPVSTQSHPQLDQEARCRSSDQPRCRSNVEQCSSTGEEQCSSTGKKQCSSAGGLLPPQMNSGEHVTGATKDKHRIENKRRRIEKQVHQQEAPDYWATHEGDYRIPVPKMGPKKHKGGMCPSGLALYHDAANLLLDYAMNGCPVKTGQDWTVGMMQAAIDNGPHASALDPAAMEQLAMEVEQKEKKGQCKTVLWDDIKSSPPPQLKISPIAMIPHKSRQFRAILDLSFAIRLVGGAGDDIWVRKRCSNC